MYNAYLPHQGPYEKIPEDTPPGPGVLPSRRGKEGILDFLKGADTGDLLLLALLYGLLKEGEEGDGLLLLVLAAAILFDDKKGSDAK